MAQILVPSQYSTIQAAVTASTSGDEIVVSAGTYNEALTITSKNNLLIRATTGDTVIITNTGILVSPDTQAMLEECLEIFVSMLLLVGNVICGRISNCLKAQL